MYIEMGDMGEAEKSCGHFSFGTDVMNGVKLPKAGDKVTMQVTGTVKSVEESQPEDTKGTVGEVELDIASVKFSETNAFTELAED